MATKNHSLDHQICEAAFQEFMANGYEKASLRKIAANADVTVGAIYTRYRTKDSLFCSLVAPLIKHIQETFGTIRNDFFSDSADAQIPHMAKLMQKESDAILHLLFDHYDQAVLLLCRSTGSSLEHFFDCVVERKIEETITFFQQMNAPHPDEKILKLLITEQFHMYFQIINEGYTLDTAKEIIHAVMVYHSGGWLALLGM